MAIEENNLLGGASLASQLEKMQSTPDVVAPTPIVSAPSTIVESQPFSVDQEQEISAGPSTLDLLDDSNDNELSTGHLYQGHKVKVKNYNTPFLFVVLGTLFFAISSIIGFSLLWYLFQESQPNTGALPNEYSQTTSQYYDEYGQSLGLFDLQKYRGEATDLTEGGTDKIKNLLADDDLNYVQKEALLQSATSDLGNKIITFKEATKTATDLLNKDGFFPEELMTILKKDNVVGSIQRSLLSLEVVKFSSAMKVFSLMDLFLSDVSSEIKVSKKEVKDRFDALMERGEGDIKNYLNYCYNNPYEPSAMCSVIGDFDRYYRLSSNDKQFDSTYFKKLMELIDHKLEYSPLPSFSITFNGFDGKSNSITFSVEVNTLFEDEQALRQQGIKSPHIYIVSELIKLLKQSTFIVGKTIDAKDIKVESKKIQMGGMEKTVNNSIKNFSLPIQKGTEREIFDYVETYQINQSLVEDTAAESTENVENTENAESTGSAVNAENTTTSVTSQTSNKKQGNREVNLSGDNDQVGDLDWFQKNSH